MKRALIVFAIRTGSLVSRAMMWFASNRDHRQNRKGRNVIAAGLKSLFRTRQPQA